MNGFSSKFCQYRHGVSRDDRELISFCGSQHEQICKKRLMSGFVSAIQVGGSKCNYLSEFTYALQTCISFADILKMFCEHFLMLLEFDFMSGKVAESYMLIHLCLQAVKQNAEYRSRLARIHADSAVGDVKGISSPFHIPGGTFIPSGPPSERVCNCAFIYSLRTY